MANSNFTITKQLSKYTVFKIYGSCSAKLTRIHNSMRSHSNSSSCKSFLDTSCSKQADKFQSCIQLQTVSTVWIKQLCQNEALARNFESRFLKDQIWRPRVHRFTTQQQLFLELSHIQRLLEKSWIFYVCLSSVVAGRSFLKLKYFTKERLATVCSLISITMVVRFWCSIVFGFMARSDWLISVRQMHSVRCT